MRDQSKPLSEAELFDAYSRTDPPMVPESGLYLVTYLDYQGIYQGAERTMTARPGGATQTAHGWNPVWIMDPSDQLGVSPGPVQILRVERIGE
jgi:hypothetical protein